MFPRTRLESPWGLRPASTHLRSLPATLVVAVAFAMVLFQRPGSAADAIDLVQRYPATLDHSTTPKGYDWTCDENDVWHVKTFAFAVGNQFRVELKSAQVVLGHHGSNVLWAAVIPDQPGEIVKAAAGQGQHITSIWLRFHPARLGEIFPPQTVTGRGDKAIIPDGKRLAACKMRSSCQSGGLPMVPEKGSVAVDLETREGPRRFFWIETDQSTVKYFAGFRKLPAAKVVDRDQALEVFDKIWSAFDREYAMFVVKPDVDWQTLRDEYRPRASAAKDNWKLAQLLAEMLGHLKDLHVWVHVDASEVPVYSRIRPLNANREALRNLLAAATITQHGLSWGITDDGIGYIAIDRLTDPQLPQFFGDVLEKMERTRGLIVDLRYNGGGSEPLGREIAGSFLDRAYIYARSQYRNGPKHTDLGVPQSRICGPTDPWHYVAPVLVLQGQRTMSSAESLVMMLSRCPQVTTMGERTAGSSGNPRVLDAGAGITVNLPRWNDLDAQSKPIDAIGIPPKIVVDAKAADFSGKADPVLAAALARLRATKAVAGKSLTLRPGAHHPNDRPHVVAVSPARGAVGVDPITEIRIRFDRPMDPESYRLHWKAVPGEGDIEGGFRLRGTIRYESKSYEFIFPVNLSPGIAQRVEVAADHPGFPRSVFGYFRSPDGVDTAGYEWQFRTRAAAKPSISTAPKFANESERAAHIEKAGRSPMLAAIVGSLRQRRRALKSLVERVDDRTQWTDQPQWFRVLSPAGCARFWWQGKSQFRADGSGFSFGTPLHVGGDDRRCWSRIGDQLVIGPSDSIAQKNVLIADPLRSASSAADEAVIKELQLEYVGDEQHGGTACHRLRSWQPRALGQAGSDETDYCEWLFDAKTLLPVLFERFGDVPVRHEYSFESIDKELPAAVFQPPSDTGLNPAEPDVLGDEFDRHFVNALDGSAGRISIRWGKTGKRGTSSSGLN